MRLHATYIQSFNYVYGVAREVEFSFKQIYKKKPHHKLLVRPSLVMGYCHGADVTVNNNTFVLNGITYTIPTGNYTGATLATALSLLTTPQLWSFTAGKLVLAGLVLSSVFTACANSAYQLMGFVEGFFYTGVDIPLTYNANFDIQSNVNLKMPEFQSKCGTTTLLTRPTGVITTSNVQGKYLVASQMTNQTLDNEQSSGSFLISDLPIVPFKVAMELPDGTPMIGTNHIFYNINFTIMEVDCDIERPVKHKVVASYIRTMIRGTFENLQGPTSHTFNGLFKKKPSNKWLIFNAMCNQNGYNGATGIGTDLFIINSPLNSKSSGFILSGSSISYNNNYYLGNCMNQTGNAMNVDIPLSRGLMNDYIIVDELIPTNFQMVIGVTNPTNNTPFDGDATFNIFEVEYN